MSGKPYFVAAMMALSASGLPCFGQRDSLTTGPVLNQLLKKFDHDRSSSFQEKLFVHTDRSFYIAGETLWFKVYCVDGTFHKPLDVSKVAYIEVIDKDNKAVVQAKIAMKDGNGNGSLFLPAILNSGHYVLRAYTQWMRNFQPDYYFQQPITLVNTFTTLGLKPPVNKPEYDVQFFPEGGNLVDGVRSKVAFRVVDKNGKGVDFRGAILDEKKDTVTRFQPLKLGIGNFMITPISNHHYTAILHDAKNNRITALFPAVQPAGYVIQVRDTTAQRVAITITSQFVNAPQPKPFVYFLAHTRQVIALAERHVLQQGKTSFLMDKKALGEGVSHFTVFSDGMVPVCERLYFKQPENNLKISIQSDQPRYSAREKIQLSLFTSTSEGKPEEATLSLSVMRLDSLDTGEQADIVSSLLLTSDLKGAIESPRSYVDGAEGTAEREAVDNLMLTHGWSRFRWEDIASKEGPVPHFIPEYGGHLLKARVINTVSGAPSQGTSAYLSTPGKSIRLYLARSNEEGIVQFEMKDFYGPKRIILQTNTEVDTTFRFEIINPYSAVFSGYRFPEFDFSDGLRSPLHDRSLNMQLQNIFFEKNIRFHTPLMDSVPFYGKPDEKYLLDEFTRFPTMEEVMREYVPGVMVRKRKDQFHFLILDHDDNVLFRDNPLVLLDGVPVFSINKIMNYDPRKVRKLEVMTHKYFLGNLSFEGLVSYTTYHGDLLDFELDTRAFTFPYEGLQLEREFFSPRYETQQARESRVPDARDMLYWSPALKTNQLGKQQLEFYSSDVPGKYLAVVQGITKNGKPGSARFTFQVINRDHY